MLEGTDYFLTVAEVAIAFVTVSAILILFRQAIGEPLSRFQLFMVRGLVELGLAVLQAALLPSLLRLVGVPVEKIWHIGSAVLGSFLFIYYVTYWFRRRRAEPEIPWLNFATVFNIGGSYLVGVLQLVNAIWIGSLGVYAIGVAWLLMILTVALAYSVPIFLRRPGGPE